MSIEDIIKENTAAMLKLAAAMGGKAEAEEEDEEEAPPPKKTRATTTKKPAGRGRSKKPAGPTKADAVNALSEVKDELGIKVAKEVLADFDVKKVDELEEGDYAEFIEACKDAMEEDD
jgi:hypothetical protein